ncbi:MAG TPA: phosphoethanolamine transferase [Burkholderiaceae bacterium]
MISQGLGRRRALAIAVALLLTLMLAIIAAGYEGKRIAQVALLALPPVLWLRLPLVSARWQTVRLLTVSFLVGLFIVDGAMRAFLYTLYGAVPDSSLVLAAAANATPREAAEYASAHGVALSVLAGGLALALAASVLCIHICNRHAEPLARFERWLLAGLLLLGIAVLASKPWRSHHPLAFWPRWAQAVHTLQTAWSGQRQHHEALLANARAAAPAVVFPGPSTVVVVLTDSINRDNMSLYGYARTTTPHLSALQAEERGKFLTLRHAWSVEPATVASLSGLFSFGARDQDDPVGDTHHLLALARAAGYRVWWMSNHDDTAIERQHAQLADALEMINREPGRSSSSLDGELLDCLEEALLDPTPRKLIIVHLLGAHPHYRLRAPESLPHLPEADDVVDAQMLQDGRPAWLRSMRRSYDRAIGYHDTVVAQTLRLSRQHAKPDGHAAWMFLSDHGQEVGHTISHAGHSPDTVAGYRIPALIWRSHANFGADVAQRPFRADWAGWTLADLMGLEWNAMAHDRNVLSDHYRWRAPTIQARVASFHQ